MNPPKVWTFETWNVPKGPSSTPVSNIYNPTRNPRVRKISSLSYQKRTAFTDTEIQQFEEVMDDLITGCGSNEKSRNRFYKLLGTVYVPNHFRVTSVFYIVDSELIKYSCYSIWYYIWHFILQDHSI